MPHIKFRYLKNQCLFFPDEKQYPIPVRMVADEKGSFRMPEEEVLVLGGAAGTAKTRTIPQFMMDYVHVYELPDIEPTIPRKRPEWDDAFYSAIKEAAYKRAVESRVKVQKTIDWFKHYVKQGVLEITEDEESLMSSDNDVSEAERDIAGIQEKRETAKFNSVQRMKPLKLKEQL